MIKRPNTNAQRLKRHKRVRAKISGTPEMPRLNVFRSEANIYAQIIDDVTGVTLVSASSLDKAVEGYGGNVAAAAAVGKLFGKARATAATASAAVCARKVFQNFGYLFVHIHFEHLADYEYKRAYNNCRACEYSRNNANRLPGFYGKAK